MKKFITSVLMFALIGTSMYSLVSCKDHDNGYEDLKSMINKEISMREALEKQVEALKAALDNVEKCKCNLEEALKNYLTKDEASKNYETIAAHNASIEMLQGLINQINLTLGNIDTSKGDVATQLNNLNVLIEQVRAIANEAMRIAKEAKCECDLTPLENSIKNLEGQIAGWTEKIEEAQRNAAEALATVKGLEAQVNQNTRDINALKDELARKYQELKDLIDRITITGCTCDLNALRQELADAKTELTTAYTLAINLAKQEITENYQAYVATQLLNYYTKGEIENMIPDVSNFLTREQIEAMIPDISNFLTRAQIEALIPDVSNFLTAQQIETLFGNYYTKDQIDALIAQAGGGGLTAEQIQQMIDNSLTGYVTETQVSQILNSYFTKEEITNMFSNYFTQEQINNMFNQYCTQEQIVNILNAYYTKEEILNTLNNYVTNEYLNNILNNYTKNEKIEEIINNYYTKEEIINKLGEYFTKSEILDMISNYCTKAEIADMLTSYYTKTEVDRLLQDFFTKDQITAELSKYYTKDEITTILGQYYTQEKINEMFDSYYTKSQIDSKLTEINNKFSDYVTVANFESTLANYYTKSEMDEKMRVINNAIDEVKDKLNKLDEKVTKLQNDLLKNQITQIIIQGTTNPVFGSIAVPADVRTTMLATYWGELPNDVLFPYSPYETDYCYKSQYNSWMKPKTPSVRYTDVIGNKVESGNILYADGHIGNIYLTINPAEVDFAGSYIDALETSGTQRQAPVSFSPLRHSNTDLNFGFTRGSNNGFYETSVTIDRNRINEARLQMDLKEVASDIKAVLKERTKASMVELGASIAKNVQNVLPAYGAKVAWRDESTGQQHSLYSQYNIGVVAVKPFTFTMLDGVTDKIAGKDGKLPGVARLQSWVGRMMKEVRKKITDNFPNFHYESLENINFESITFGQGINPETGKGYDIQTQDKKDANGNIVYDENGNPVQVVLVHVTGHIKGNANGEVPFDYTGDQNTGSFTFKDGEGNTYSSDGFTFTFNINTTVDITNLPVDADFEADGDATAMLKDLVEAINERYGEGSPIDKAIADLVNALKEFNDLEDVLTGTVTDYEVRINRFITRVNNKLIGWMNKAERALQLCMVGSQGNGMSLISRSLEMPSKKFKAGQITLYPTSYSLEIFAPAYKKFVAVTNVFDKNGNQISNYEAEARAANGSNMATVYDGRKKCTMTGKSGYIYEISFAALDFHGKICVKKFYIEVK